MVTVNGKLVSLIFRQGMGILRKQRFLRSRNSNLRMISRKKSNLKILRHHLCSRLHTPRNSLIKLYTESFGKFWNTVYASIYMDHMFENKSQDYKTTLTIKFSETMPQWHIVAYSFFTRNKNNLSIKSMLHLKLLLLFACNYSFMSK